MNDLLRQLRMDKPGLADDLQREFDALADRRSFGLNFERHVPEAVELPGRQVRKGDKVRVLPPRGEARKREHDRLWQVVGVSSGVGGREAALVSLDQDEDEADAATDDLVVVAEFRDPIYPGLVSTGKVERGGDKPYHAVINAENYHALQTLLFTHRGKVDCIYIDPPYNTGAKDWKYNNNYVEGDDLYRHSKWLAFMERRMQLAKELLNPESSVLIVTIDEKEYARLALLLEQVFPDARIQMVTAVTNPNGSARLGELTRVNEFIFFCFLGNAKPVATQRSLRGEPREESTEQVRWERLMKGSNNALRSDRPNLFYPVFVDADTWRILGVGQALPPEQDRHTVSPPEGAEIVWPLSREGVEKRWQVSVDSFKKMVASGTARVGSYDSKNRQWSISYLNRGQVERWERGDYEEVGRDENGVVILRATGVVPKAAPTVWDSSAHNAGEHGSRLLRTLMPDRKFPFPKSLYAVEDTLAIVLASRPSAVVLDFFSGSGTTAHAVMRLNKQDGGRRQCFSVTNNEVGVDEQKALGKRDLRPGDPEWEALGICDFITKPRMTAAITGKTPGGMPIKGAYRFTDEFPMADGFEENIEFFTLTYEAPLRMASNREFKKIAPLLWLRAGSHGRRIDDISNGWDVADVYGVIADLDQAEPFLKALADNDEATMVFIVTDEDRLFEALVAELPEHVEPVRLYEAYLRNFEIEAGRSSR
ncbi:site-specific DNA-methyltransferase [Terrabacter sp. 2YAF2]|uniref:site-specific DNA-methyltransferase n=1 Tax=Terrabacter sp. 2YAF2 TaxID=3233026 RepID=UPI003F95CCCE